MKLSSAEKGVIIGQIQVDVTLFSIMLGIVTLFSGLLLTRYPSNEHELGIPIAFLILSILAFLISSLILANIIQELRRGKLRDVERHLTSGYMISEYLGVYPFLFSIPLSVNIFTESIYLRFVSFTLSLLALAYYQFSHFSNLERHFPRTYFWLSWVTILVMIGFYFTYSNEYFAEQISLIVMSYFFCMTGLALKCSSSRNM